MYNNILFSTLESQKEKFFNHKCRDLLKYYSKERLLEFIGSYSMFIDLFQTNLLSCDDINHILLKKYFVSKSQKNNITSSIDLCIERLDIELANNLLNDDINLTREVFRVYLDNINVSNAHLAIEKSYTRNYDDIVFSLNTIDRFYKSKYFNHQNQMLIKKYEY